MADTKLKDYLGVEIFVTEEGKFTATFDKKKSTVKDLKTLELAIRSRSVGVQAIIQRQDYFKGEWQNFAEQVEITGTTKRGYIQYFSYAGNNTQEAWLFEPEKFEQLKEVLSEKLAAVQRHKAEIAALDKKQREIGLVPITLQLYEQLVSKARQESAEVTPDAGG